MTLLSRMLRFAIIFFYVMIFCVTLVYGGKTSVLMAVALMLVPLVFTKPEYFFIFFMITRPLADAASTTTVLGLNTASWFTIVFIAFCIKEFLAADRDHQGRPEKLLRNFNNYFMALLFVYLPSFLYTDDLRVSLMDTIRIASVGIAVNYLIRRFYQERKDIDLYCNMALLSAVIPLALGLIQWATHTGKYIEGYNRIYGTFTHPNVFAEYLLFIFFIALYGFQYFQISRVRKAAYLFFILIVLFALYQTYTRTMWIAFAVCLFIYALVQRRAAVRGVFLAIMGCFMVMAIPLASSRFADIIHASSDGRKSSLQWRLHLWRQTMGGIKEHPFFGSGLGMYEQRIGVMAHNDILRMAYETGLIATLLYLTGFFLLILYAWRESRKPQADDARVARVQISACLMLGFLISSLADNMLRSTVILFYYFTAVMLFLSRKKEEAAA